MAKNNLNAEKLQQNFDDKEILPFMEHDETHNLSEKVKALTEEYLKTLDELLKDIT